MPTENKPAESLPTLATGAALDASTWTDFVQRLRYDCKGERVNDHCTSAAIFIVEARRIVCGLDMDYTERRLVYWDGGESVAYSARHRGLRPHLLRHPAGHCGDISISITRI